MNRNKVATAIREKIGKGEYGKRNSAQYQKARNVLYTIQCWAINQVDVTPRELPYKKQA